MLALNITCNHLRLVVFSPHRLSEQVEVLAFVPQRSVDTVYNLMTEQKNMLFDFGRTQNALWASSPLQ